MARIADEVVKRLKREVSLERLVRASGVELKKHGENLLGRCPFHDDREPSLVVTPSKNLWHCLGACQAGGSVIDYVMRRERCSYRAALELLLKDAPVLAASLEAAPPRTTSAKLEELAKPEEPDAVVLRRVVDFYHATLKESPEALGYLASRGLKNAELVDAFKLGFSNRTLGYRLPPAQVKAGASLRGQLQRLGIYRESGHEHFNGSLVVPIFDAAGQVSEMYGRKVTARLREGTPLHLYLPGPHRGIFNSAAFRAGKEVILCESIIDALTFWSAGFVNVTTSYGVEGFTPELREAFGSHGIERVLIAYDRDDAGDKAAEKLAPELASQGMEVLRVLFPRGMDANEYAQKIQPARRALETAIKAAHWMAGKRPVSVPSTLIDAHARDTVEAEQAKKAEEEAERATVEACGETPPEDVTLTRSTSEVEAEAAPPLAAVSDVEPGRADVACTPPASAAHRTAAAEAEEAPTRPELPVHADVPAEVGEEQVVIKLGDRTWRVRGLERNMSYDHLKVSVLVGRGDAFHVDQVELYSARHRAAFLKAAAGELQLEERILKSDLGKVFWKLERLQDEQIKRTLEVKPEPHAMSDAEREEALLLLKDPQLIERILEDFAKCGVVGEETNKLVGYLAAVSRKLEEPLAVVIQSSTAAGKSSLMDAVMGFVPEEEKVAYSAMTGQSLFYMGATDLQHKVLAIAEEEGASHAAYALKILQSAGELTIASTGKDPQTGRLVTQEYRVTGPVMVMMTTTSIDIDEELLNRCLVLTVDEGADQTKAIQELQRASRTLAGRRLKHGRGRIMAAHQNAQRLLRPVTVVNELAPGLAFSSHTARMRRDHKKYLTLIDTIAFLHQHQRPVKTDAESGMRYIEVVESDIELANRLCAGALASTVDELAPQTRRLLEALCALVAEQSAQQGIERGDVRFSRRFVRERLSWGETQLRVHLERLVALEYVVPHRGSRGKSYVYELAYEPAPANANVLGAAPASSSAPAMRTTATSRGQGGHVAGTSRGALREVSASDVTHLQDLAGSGEKAQRGQRANGASYAAKRAAAGAP
jgi:DNA primase catalytic core